MALRIILIGPPGVGKGTQAAMLENRLRLTPISTGVIFRQAIEAKTEMGQLADTFIRRGCLVPDEVTNGIVAEVLGRLADNQAGFILDGFPRNPAQAVFLDETLAKLGIALDCVISIEAPDDIIVKRIAGRVECQRCREVRQLDLAKQQGIDLLNQDYCPFEMREDDRPETIQNRLNIFHEQTAPVLAHYEAQGTILRIDGTLAPEQVYDQIHTRLFV